MLNINKNFEQITNPTNDFLVINDLLKNKEYIKSVYEKVFTEISKFIEKIPKINIQACNLRKDSQANNYIGKIHFASKKNQHIVTCIFNNGNLQMKINGKNIGESMIYGADMNKEALIPTNIKIDLISFKEELSKLD